MVVSRSRWTISRPQTIHAQGSYVGVEGNAREGGDDQAADGKRGTGAPIVRRSIVPAATAGRYR